MNEQEILRNLKADARRTIAKHFTKRAQKQNAYIEVQKDMDKIVESAYYNKRIFDDNISII